MAAAGNTEQVATRVDPETAAGLAEWAEREGRSVANLARQIIAAAVASERARQERLAARRAS